MRKSPENLLLCGMVFAVALVTSNVIAAKTIATGIPLFGSTIVVPSAVICYAITFLMTDVVGELWGPAQAKLIVKWGFVCQVISTLLVIIAGAMPAADGAMGDAFALLLGQNAVFVLGSLAGYVLSQSWDVWLFHRIRACYAARPDGMRKRWIWNNASTMTSQFIDTVVYITIAFGFGFGWLFDAAMLPTLGAMIVGQYLVKLVLAAVDTPVFYLLTRSESAGQRIVDAAAREGRDS